LPRTDSTCRSGRIRRGDLDERRVCKTLTFCTYLMRQKNHPLGQFPTGCPPFDKEGYGEIMKKRGRRSAAQRALTILTIMKVVKYRSVLKQSLATSRWALFFFVRKFHF